MLSTAYRAVLRLLLLGVTFAAPISLALLGRAPIAALVIWLVTALVIAAAPGELWPQRHFASGVACVLVGGALAWAAALVGFLATFAIAISSSLCGDQTPVAYWLPVLTVYAAGGSWALAGRPRRALLGMPAAVLLAAGIGLALFASVPGAHGYCET
jgi:hypothetical protein